MKNCNYIISLCLLAVLPLKATLAQQKSDTEKVDSILAVMPQLNDSEKDNALRLLIMLTTGTPDEKYYTKNYPAFGNMRYL